MDVVSHHGLQPTEPTRLISASILINCIQQPTDRHGSVGSAVTTTHPIVSATITPASHLIMPATISPHPPVNPTIHSNPSLQLLPNPDPVIQ